VPKNQKIITFVMLINDDKLANIILFINIFQVEFICSWNKINY